MAASPLPPTPASVPASESAPLSEGARIVDTFIAPSKTFTDLRRNASWWGPWLLISIFALIFVYSIDRQIGFEQVSKNAVAQSARADQFDKLPAEQQEKQLRFTSTLIRYMSYGSPVTILIFFALGAVVLWVTFRFATGADVAFKTAYAIVFYASLPGIVGSILGTISLYAGVNPEGFDVNNPVATNLAHVLDKATTGKFVYSLASALDLLSIWTIVLMGIGFSSTSKVKRSTAIAVVAGWYLFWKLAAAGLASMS